MDTGVTSTSTIVLTHSEFEIIQNSLEHYIGVAEAHPDNKNAVSEGEALKTLLTQLRKYN